MLLTNIAWFVRLDVIVFLGGLAAIIAYRLLTGGINTKYLLYSKGKGGKRSLSPERVQLLLFTLGTAMAYLLEVTNQIERTKPGEALSLPDIPVKTLALLAGSHGIYLGGKAYSMLFKRIAKGE
jgi:hypothetical protein